MKLELGLDLEPELELNPWVGLGAGTVTGDDLG